MKSTILLVVLLASVTTFSNAQESPIDAPSASMSPQSSASSEQERLRIRDLRRNTPTFSITTTPQIQARSVVDKHFVLQQIYPVLASVSDIQLTRYALRNGFVEGSPLFGHHPSASTMYGVSMPLCVVTTFWSYRLKKASPHSKLWTIPPLVLGSVHIAATTYTFFTM